MPGEELNFLDELFIANQSWQTSLVKRPRSQEVIKVLKSSRTQFLLVLLVDSRDEVSEKGIKAILFITKCSKNCPVQGTEIES